MIGAIYHVEEQVRIGKFIECGGEGSHKRLGKILQEADSVCHNYLSLSGKSQPPTGGVQRREELVLY
jgi:hypothetical protein